MIRGLLIHHEVVCLGNSATQNRFVFLAQHRLNLWISVHQNLLSKIMTVVEHAAMDTHAVHILQALKWLRFFVFVKLTRVVERLLVDRALSLAREPCILGRPTHGSLCAAAHLLFLIPCHDLGLWQNLLVEVFFNVSFIFFVIFVLFFNGESHFEKLDESLDGLWWY